MRLLEKKRFVSLLDIARREGELLLKTDVRLFTSKINANWVRQLEYDDDLAERLDAFVSRFGRLQDTLGDKLLPSLLRLLAEKTGSALDNLNKAEKLGLLASVISWARLLKRVFDIDIEHCPHCGGTLKIIAAILESSVITKILDHLGLPTRAPPRSPAQIFDIFEPA